MSEPVSGPGNAAALRLRRIRAIFPFADGGHRRSGGSFDTRATKAALIVASKREERGHMRIVAQRDGGSEGGMERGRDGGGERVMQMQPRRTRGQNIIALLQEDNEQQVTDFFILSF